jgi:hypothetical protein
MKVKSHIIAESLITPACKKKKISRTTGTEAESEIDEVPVSYNTISRRVDDATRRRYIV